MDEIDAIGGRRFSEGTSADREIQRTLMELLNQLDGFDELGKVMIYPPYIFLFMCRVKNFLLGISIVRCIALVFFFLEFLCA
jgi:hypothetical protein